MLRRTMEREFAQALTQGLNRPLPSSGLFQPEPEQQESFDPSILDW